MPKPSAGTVEGRRSVRLTMLPSEPHAAAAPEIGYTKCIIISLATWHWTYGCTRAMISSE